MKSLKLLFILLPLLATSCNKEEIPKTGMVSGELTLYDPSSPLVKYPAKDVKLYLIDNETISDTIKHKSYSESIVDSATTSETGIYLIDNIPWGNYSLITVPDGTRYRFVPAGYPDHNDFILTGTSPKHGLDLTSPLPDGVNDDNRKFYINLRFNNPELKSFSYIARRQYLQYIIIVPFVIPFFVDGSKSYLRNAIETTSISDWWGYYYGVGVCTNNYLIEIWDSNNNYYHSFWITWPSLDKTPPESFWTIDLANKTITCVEEKWN